MVADSLVTTVSPKGQVNLLKAIHDELGWGAGTRLVVEHTPDGVLLTQIVMIVALTRLEDVSSCHLIKGGPRSVKDVNTGIVASESTAAKT